MPGRLEFSIGLGTPAPQRRRSAAGPMRILLLGDFSGRGSRGLHHISSLAERPAHRVDLDSFDPLLRKIAPAIALPPESGAGTILEFGTLDDFHPDRVYERVAVFGALRTLRDRLADPATFESAAAELRAQGVVAAGAIAPGPLAKTSSAESDAGTLDRLLGHGATPTATPRTASAIDGLIRELVAPHIVPDRAPHQPMYVAALDATIGEQMRHCLHDPAFLALESAWRGVAWLVSRLELGEELQLYLLDVTRAELHQDLQSAREDIPRSALYRNVCRRAADEGPRWSLLAGLMSIGADTDDLGDLAALGAIAAHAGGPIILAAAPSLYGCDSVAHLADPLTWQALPEDAAEHWSALRRSAIAPWIGLVAPRFLLRLPYGKSTDATERFAFEEQPAIPRHESLLWAPGSLAVALQFGLAFSDGGWAGVASPAPDVDDLPAYPIRRDGEAELQPCGEAWLGEQAGEALLAMGVMPLLSHRQRAAVRLARLQSIAEQVTPLAGPWA